MARTKKCRDCGDVIESWMADKCQNRKCPAFLARAFRSELGGMGAEDDDDALEMSRQISRWTH